MLWQHVRFALLAGVCLAGTAASVRAEDAQSPTAGASAASCSCKVQVTEWVPEPYQCTRTYCVSVPCVENRVVMQSHYTCKPVTKIVRKCVDQGHWECQEVPCRPTLMERLRRLCGKDCCECQRTELKKVWVKCPVIVETPVTCMERVCEYRPVTCQFKSCKMETRQEVVTMCRLVPRVVEREIPTVTCCSPCCNTCCTSCCKTRCCAPAPCCCK